MAPRTAKDPLKQWRKDAQSLSYEEALQAADLLLNQLQSDTIPLADLQQTYQRGQIYLEHCETLLAAVEQSVLTLDPDTMTSQPLKDSANND
ncbi:exodeoxyribonuclease VII small subunit [Synechococcus sp. RS9916]|uniref:exodeoxyribonuclease VII small subunit n=1 Tax=Synechococcus sp. RS9916 TaxID=221359 RepID=UPI0000E535D1|nr:exodeoxyribonuclease VII small subunit [Synechococcus sp. RS9916]EAU74930.1 exodeoxyribonuclease VII small subunit [Synechococcus sp. RS9916]